MANTLVIVESPGKIKKIEKYLGQGYTVIASVGHIRDLPSKENPIPDKYKNEPWANLGIDPKDFSPVYVISRNKQDVVKRIRYFAEKSDKVLLAMDSDREGEAIAWHVAKVAKLSDPQRIVFTEITKDALKKAVASPRPLDLNLVAAQETRRIIDRLVGYGLSPLLWNSLMPKTDEGTYLSAGRVQSAALMLIARRELSRMSFVSSEYWNIKADALTKPSFVAMVTKIKTRAFPDGINLAKASDFDANGKLKEGSEVICLTEEQAKKVSELLEEAPAVVIDIKKQDSKVKPPAPFITSSLQKAAKSIGLKIADIMVIAQQLYEGGHITYMRTDSPSLSDEALAAARSEAIRLFGDDAIPVEARQYATRDKNAQEAHEAIRPAGSTFKSPDSLNSELTADQIKVYELIYKRTVASQMQDAEVAKTEVTLKTRLAELKATGKVVLKPGFMALIKPDTEDKDEDKKLPDLSVGQEVGLKPKIPERKRTTPAERYSEGSLIDAMKSAGIGRPSTYSSVISTLVKHNYAISRKGDFLALSAIGMVVSAYLFRQVPSVTEKSFTAQMENDLDAIAQGKLKRIAYLENFWTNGLEVAIGKAERRSSAVNIPHLSNTVLLCNRAGITLSNGNQRIPIPTSTVIADIRVEDLPSIFAGNWKQTNQEATEKANSTKKRKRQPRTKK